MKTVLKLPAGLEEDLRSHLLREGSLREEAAFLVVTSRQSDDVTVFDSVAVEKLLPDDFAAHRGDYLELRDETRARLIKKAHDLGGSLVEMHSHPGPYEACFSDADRVGLAETVPHMWWRLKKRPYLAIVVADSGFDALVWLENSHTPQALDALMAGDRLLRPTNHSLGGW